MPAIEDIVVELAHELRQPLSVLEASTYLLLRMIPPEQVAAREELERIYVQVDLAHEAVNRAVGAFTRLRHQREGGAPAEAAAESRSLTNAAMAGVTY